MGGDSMTKTYYPTHTRMGAWLVGVALGYILHNLKGKALKIPKVKIRISIKVMTPTTNLILDLCCTRLDYCIGNNAFNNIWNIFFATTGLPSNSIGKCLL